MLTSQEIEIIDKVTNSFGDSFIEISDKMDSNHRIYDFVDNSLLLNSYKDIYYYKVLAIKDIRIDTRFLILKVTSTFPTTKKNVQISEIQLIGIKILDRDYGHILIRPESIEDKINELFNKSEMDFKDFPKFSSKYYYLSEDSNLGFIFATDNRLGLIEKQKDILIEIKGNMMIAKYPRVFNDLDFMNLFELIKQI